MSCLFEMPVNLVLFIRSFEQLGFSGKERIFKKERHDSSGSPVFDCWKVSCIYRVLVSCTILVFWKVSRGQQISAQILYIILWVEQGEWLWDLSQWPLNFSRVHPDLSLHCILALPPTSSLFAYINTFNPLRRRAT